jgi:hypothetical protein
MAEKTRDKAISSAEKDEKAVAQRTFSALDKCKAVLSLWSERRKVMEICQELGIPWNLLHHWQNRAMEGMLQALEARVLLERGPALSARLQAMLERRANPLPQAPSKLEERLSRIQQARESKKDPETKPKKA